MRIAIYTCVIGGYDIISPPLAIEDNCDYYIISDDSSLANNVFKWIDVNSLIPNINMSPKDKNRYCKMNPHKIFPNFDFTIYLDGSIQIIKPISHNIDKVGITGLALHKHRKSDCIYSEAIFLNWLGVIRNKKDIVDEMNRYINDGFPKHFGMFECGMIVTDLNNYKGKKLYSKWYEEYLRGAKRDQQALMYSLWKLGYVKEDIGNLGGKYNILTNPEICWNKNAHYK